MVKKWGQRIYLAVIFLFLYLPILVLIVLSFNNSKSRVVWAVLRSNGTLPVLRTRPS